MGLRKMFGLCKKLDLTGEEREAWIRRSKHYQYEYRLPDVTEKMEEFIMFLGERYLQHPKETVHEAYRACRTAHPEWWNESQEAYQ